MNTLRLGSGRQYRSAPLVEMPLPLAYDAALLPGARILGEDGQIYESMRDPVSGLYEWKVRAQGERGPAVELQKSATHLQWRVEGSAGAWIDLVPLVDLLGPKGDQGDQGPQGAGLSFQGTVATVADLPSPSTLGYGYLVTATTPPRLYVYNGTTWVDAGPIQGPKGDQGDPGSEVELQKTSTEIQWRRVGAPTWTTLVLLADLKGDAGASVELRKTSTEIQWRQVGAPTWITLVPLDDIKGPVGDQGDQGIQGNPGPGFSYQGTVATVADLPIPSTQGFGFLVVATGDLHIYNGTAWVNAGPLQGPKGDQGDQGIQGNPGPGFSYQGTVATVADLPIPSTQGFAFLVVATGDLHIYNGTAWVNAGPLQGPKGDQGDQGIQGNPGPGFSYQGTVATVADLPIPSTQGFGFLVLATGDLWIYNGTAWVNAGPLQGPKGDPGEAGAEGEPGEEGPAGPGLPTGGSIGQMIRKVSATDYDTEWFSLEAAVIYRWGEVPVGSRTIGVPGSVGFGITDPALDLPQIERVRRIAQEFASGATEGYVKDPDGNILIQPTGTGRVKLSHHFYPNTQAADTRPAWGLRVDGAGNLQFAPLDRFGIVPVGSEIIGTPGQIGFGIADPPLTDYQLRSVIDPIVRRVVDLEQKVAVLFDLYLRELGMRSSGITVGVPGAVNFGAGPAVTAGIPVGISEQDYYPFHANSNSFM